MFQRFCVLTIVVALAASLVPFASGARVRVRIEGKTTTIFGATEPRVAADHALGALESASLAGEFYYHVQTSSFGSYVDQIGRFPAGGTSGWVFKVNDISPPVGADKVELRDGDRVLWYFAQFGVVPGGPPTLRLARTRNRCYAVTALDDAGKTRKPTRAVLRVDGRTVRTQGGVACPGPHRGLVRATAPGAVRSNALS
ncbi:MAG: DUF4430 domain-containing protein [Actinobacteria bacterium]|nr:DUF4430 domain-containing protein [Actinomycetota bacterium]